MGKRGAVPLQPPAPTSGAVRAHRRKIVESCDALRGTAAALALASARGEAGAAAALADLYLKIRVAEFEIECSDAAFELATKEDAAAEAAWRASIQALGLDEILDGIGKDSCCSRCTPGSHGGCVLTASAPQAGSTCSHPVKEMLHFYTDNSGKRIFRHRGNPQASRLFDAACDRLNVRKAFAP